MTDQTSETTPDGLDVAAVRARVEAATEGPWEASLVGIDPVEDEYVVQTEAVADVVCRLKRADEFIEHPMAAACDDATFIAHARTDIPLLLAALDEARVRANRAELQRDVATVQHDECHHAFDRAKTALEAAEARAAAADRVLEQVVNRIEDQREAFLPSPNLDPGWIAGWHAAVDHVAHALATADADATEGEA